MFDHFTHQLSNGGGSVDSHPLYQDMFSAMFDDLQAKFCRGLDLAAENDSFPCWNGTHVASYTRNLTYFNQVKVNLETTINDVILVILAMVPDIIVAYKRSCFNTKHDSRDRSQLPSCY